MFKVEFISMLVLKDMYSLNHSKIHSIFKNVINVEYNDKLISMQNSNVPKGPLSISINDSVNFLDLPIKIGDVITIKKDVICIGSISVNIERPLIWDPRLKDYFLLSKNKEQINKLKNIVILYGKSGGIKEEVLSIITDNQETFKDKNKENIVRVLNEAYKDFYNKKQTDASVKLSSLIGYGAGLTPAGDDFLVGVMSVLHCLKKLDVSLLELYEKLSNEILKSSRKTTSVSKTFLEEAVERRFSESFHKLYEALWSKNSEELYKATISMISIGHSSGTDGLCGILWGFYLISNLKTMEDSYDS
ncbi:MAG: DUF2877 domain-containing protein [Clostridiaceae bacterium]